MFDERNMGVEVRHAKKSRPRSSTKRGPFLRASLRTKGKHMQRFCQTTRECPVKFPRREGHLFLPVEEGPARVGRSTAGRSVRRRRVRAPGLMAENFILSLPGTSKLDLSRPSASPAHSGQYSGHVNSGQGHIGTPRSNAGKCWDRSRRCRKGWRARSGSDHRTRLQCG
jgi:hypothetical protein